MTRPAGQGDGHGEDHRTAQLCAEIETILSLALASAADPRLRDLDVRRVVPTGSLSRLRVELVPDSNLNLEEMEKAYASVVRARSWLRRQVAQEIRRKRIPELEFGFADPVMDEEVAGPVPPKGQG